MIVHPDIPKTVHGLVPTQSKTSPSYRFNMKTVKFLPTRA